MKLAALVSGGKDSLYAIYLAKKQGHSVECILLMIPETNESWMFHHPNAWIVKLHAESMGVKILTAFTKGEKEKELEDLKALISKARSGVDGIVSGAVASRYQSDRLKNICDEFGLEIISPLWGRDLNTYWEELLDNGFEIIITSVSAQGLGKEWLGRSMDKKATEELKTIAKKNKMNLAGEGGEFETLVLNCPLFKKRIKISKSETKWDSKMQTGQFLITEATLE
ncbi:MAG: diphthine--ammonia ligase [Candidatus Aenigmatarchaeota archaeon]